MLQFLFSTVPLWLWRKIFGSSVAGATLAYLFAALAFVGGVVTGISVNQPLVAAPPARQLLQTADRIEQTLLTAQVAVDGKKGEAEVESSLAAARRDIRARSEALRQLTANSDG